MNAEHENKVRTLNFIRFLDEARWTIRHDEKVSESYDIPNYANRNMSAEQKLLTHFLGYITNRQISYKFVFAKLDFIFSQMVSDFDTHPAYDLLLDPGKYFDHEGDGKNKKGGFKACRLMDDQAQYWEDKRLRGEQITASSRFFPTDFVGIFCALEVLAHFTGKSFAAYIRKCLALAAPEREMEYLLYGLWLLGYSDIGQWKTEDLDPKAIQDRCLVRKYAAIGSFFDGGGIPESFRKELYKNKRLTCFVRDLLKCEHFRSLFSEIVSPQTMDHLQDQRHLLELPGDVWNNNSSFRECFLQKVNIDTSPKEHFNKVVRDIYEKAWDELSVDKNSYYPEQLDTTFDFVPRMCEQNGQTNCRYCPLKREDGKIAEEFCVAEHDDKFCPFLLYACGYKVPCREMRNCPNKQLSKREAL